MASFNSTPTLLFLLSLLAVTATTGALGAYNGNMTHLHFFMHDIFSGPNATVFKVVKGPGKATNFGDLYVLDDPLTKTGSPTSELLGRAQGSYVFSDLSSPALLMTVNLVLTSGEYNGSTIAVFGRESTTLPESELPIIGGTGSFRMAKGYVHATTYFYDPNTGDAILEFDVFVE